MSVKSFFQQCGYDVYVKSSNQLHICKDKTCMTVEIIMDKNWYTKEYALDHMLIPKNDIRTNSDWVCMTSRDKSQFKIFPMCVVKTAQQVYKESSGSKKDIIYAIDIQFGDKKLYFV